MRRNKKGISLIVLVITIIVMIILAAAVMISLSNTGILDKANEAVDASNMNAIQNIASLAWSEAYLDKLSGKTVDMEERIRAALRDNKVDDKKYNIVLGESGVEVVEKGSWRMVEPTKNAEGKITELKVTNGELTLDVGTTINYMPDGVGKTNYKGGWKILGVDEHGRLLILSNKSVLGESEPLRLGSDESIEKAAEEYKNALTTIQKAVSSYKDGKIGIEVRSIDEDDINNLTGYDPTTYGEGEDWIYAYGNKVTYSWSSTAGDYKVYYKYGDMTSPEQATWGNTTGMFYYPDANNNLKSSKQENNLGKTITTITSTSYDYDTIEYMDENLPAYDMLYETEDEDYCWYWLASRYIITNTFNAYFGLRYVDSGYISDNNLFDSYGNSLFYSDGEYYCDECAVRAVVTLASDIQVKEGSVSGTYDVK